MLPISSLLASGQDESLDFSSVPLSHRGDRRNGTRVRLTAKVEYRTGTAGARPLHSDHRCRRGPQTSCFSNCYPLILPGVELARRGRDRQPNRNLPEA